MNKIEKLIEELCPEGVPFKQLGQVAVVSKGMQVNRETLDDMNPFPVYNGGIYPSGRHTESNFPAQTITVSQGGASAGYVNFVMEPLWVGAHCYAVVPGPSVINRFLFFVIKTQQDNLQGKKYGAGIPALDKKTLSNLQVPVPPIVVQQEIISILDKFTELEAELEAERESRVHEVSYFRQKLLDFSGAQQDNPLKSLLGGLPLGDLRLEPIGKHIKYEQPTNYIVSRTDYDDSKPTPVLTAGQKFVLGYTDETFGVFQASPQNPVIIFDDFTTAYKWVDFPFKVKSSAMKILSPSDNSILNLRFLFHFMSVINFTPSEHARHWISNYSQIDITIPPIIQQNKIVSILDKFIALEVGLAAEIEARARQYEYYRNKLLTFKELKAS
jgi:type I restriction enzyme S subunit